jgi:uncharacterized protein YyaL (SSP411 family)
MRADRSPLRPVFWLAAGLTLVAGALSCGGSQPIGASAADSPSEAAHDVTSDATTAPDPTEVGPTAAVAVGTPFPGGVPFPASVAEAIQESARSRPADYVPRTRHRQPDGSASFWNRLSLETSPYLQQHAHNPVNWFPWGDEAFETARRLGRPVLLSVGYSTCHWCHVMEEESFEDLEIARYLNENYVAIKVDREERPDVDAIYMAAIHAMRGRGGWPMNVWLTADAKPFYGGTYFPARDGDRGTRHGFLTVLSKLKQEFDANPEGVAETADALAARLIRSLAPNTSGDLPGAGSLSRAGDRYRGAFDETYGGRQGRPKFPSSLPMRFLLQEYQRTGDEVLLGMATHTLTMMAAGGMYDQVGGGFHRYSTDSRWLVPHFEKMLYDNALLAVAYTRAWQVTGADEMERVAREILRYVGRDMTTPEGAFYSATDADSPVPGKDEQEEGWFFTWTPDEVHAVLDAKHAEAVIAYYGVSPRGNFEGRSILHTAQPMDEVASALDLSVPELRQRIAEARETLYTHRLTRPPPLRDDKVIAAWNGLMISAYAQAALAFGDEDYARRAARAASFVLDRMRVDGRLRRTYKDGRARHNAMLDDYAFVIAGLLDLFEATGEPRWLREAIALERTAAEHYEDKTSGGFFRTADDAEGLLARERAVDDGAEPSGQSVHTLNLLRLSELTTNDRYRERADGALRSVGRLMSRSPTAMSEMLLAVDWRADAAKEVVIVTRSSRADADELLRVLSRHGPRNRVLIVANEADVEDLATLIPLIGGKVVRNPESAVTAYVCEQGYCQLPTDDAAVFADQLRGTP